MKNISNKIEFKSSLLEVAKKQQSCKLYISDTLGNSWSFYFIKGSLLWSISSYHRVRRIDRLIHKHCPKINLNKVKLREQEVSELREYLLIYILIQRKIISIEQANKIILELTCEHLFDCFQANDKIKNTKLIFETSANSMGSILRSDLFKHPIIFMDINKLLSYTENKYSIWVKANLVTYYPNLAPIIQNNNKLKQLVGKDDYDNLFILIDGKKTLRELEMIAKQELLTLTCSLVPYIEKNLIELQSVEDKQLKNIYFFSSRLSSNVKYTQSEAERNYIKESYLPLIICIDDDDLIGQEVIRIFNDVGYQIILVNESFQALNVLLENKPDVIFLDLIMPVVNGYELCYQIRKIPLFKTTPIVTFMERDQLITRVRAKMAGATDSICKPIDEEKILAVTQKVLNSVNRH